MSQPNSGILPPEILLPAQSEIRDIAVGMNPTPQYTGYEAPWADVNPEEVREKLLRSSLGDLMLQSGGTLTSAEGPSTEPVTLTPGTDGDLVGVSANMHALTYPRRRLITPEKFAELGITDSQRFIETGNGYLVDFPGERDWSGDVGVTFWYQKTEKTPPKGEMIVVSTDHSKPGTMPTVESKIATYGTQANDGRTNYTARTRLAVSEAEVRFLLGAAEKLTTAPRR